MSEQTTKRDPIPLSVALAVVIGAVLAVIIMTVTVSYYEHATTVKAMELGYTQQVASDGHRLVWVKDEER